jgi:hypothetical protein
MTRRRSAFSRRRASNWNTSRPSFMWSNISRK